MNFYMKRIEDGLFAEKSASVLAKSNCTYDEAESLILVYPLKRFSDIGAIHYDKEQNVVFVDASIWLNLSSEDINWIKERCNKAIEEYYERYCC